LQEVVNIVVHVVVHVIVRPARPVFEDVAIVTADSFLELPMRHFDSNGWIVRGFAATETRSTKDKCRGFGRFALCC